MRVRSILTASAALAVVFGASYAQAASKSEAKIPLDLSFFAPTQIDVDGRAYGVGTVHGSGTNQIITPLGPVIRVDNPATPGACTGHGWCDTPHHIASSAFGWNFAYTGAGAIIGVVDTGIDLNQPEFTGRILTGSCIISSVNACTSLNDQVGGDLATFDGGQSTHGTHVAGIAAGSTVGIATSASILPVKVCASFANSCNGVDEGLLWASQHGANVINVSIGGPILNESDVDIFRQTVANGSLIVVSAGNSGTRVPAGGFLSGGALADGVRGSMIVVGATGHGGVGGHGDAADFSQVPSTRCEIHGAQRYCMRDFFVAAPGENIWSTVGNGAAAGSDHGYLSGTSMAAPYVTGVAAVIKGRWPSLTSAQIANIIFTTADDIGAPGVDPVYGRGAVDITNAMSISSGPSLLSNRPLNATSFALTGGAGGSGGFGARSSLVSGPLSVAVQNSSVLRNALVIDGYGRDFSADFSSSTYNPAFNLDYLVTTGFNTSFSPFAFSQATPIGNFTASGYAVDTTTPALLSGEFRTSDKHKYDVQDFHLATTVAPGVALELGYNARMAGNFNSYDAVTSQAYDGLFISASGVNSPYVSFADGGNYIGTTVDLADDLHLRVAQASMAPRNEDFEVPVFSLLEQTTRGTQSSFDRRAADASMVAMNWDFASWGGLGVTASQTSERNGLLGGMASGALTLANSADTTALGITGRVGFGDGWVTTVSYSEGMTNLNLKADSIFTGADTLRSRSYGLAIAKHGLFDKGDSLGLAVSRPVQVYAGSLNVSAATGIDADRNLVISHEKVSLVSGTPETDVEMGYVTTFFDGSLALQANAGYQMNVAGESGRNGLTVLSRAKINF